LDYVYIGIFGCLGAVARFTISRYFAFTWHSSFPLGTLVINLAGCLAMGFLLTYSTERLTLSPQLRAGLITGFIGAFTTFSTFSLETLTLFTKGYITYAILYVLLSVMGGLAAARTGINMARFTVPLSAGQRSKA